MNNSPLRIEQLDTVLYNANLNPMGTPDSVIRSISENLSGVTRYPDDYYPALKTAIAEYAGCPESELMLGSSLSDMLKKLIFVLKPKKALVFAPSSLEYENALLAYGCEIVHYELDEADNFSFDLAKFAGSVDSSIDMIIVGNPNNPTSQIIDRDDIETLAEICAQLDAALVVDEMYIEFTTEHKDITSVPLVSDHKNLYVLRSTSKFFAVPGLRLAYCISSDNACYVDVRQYFCKNSITALTAVAGTAMFKDEKYIKETVSSVGTERNLIYSAMSPCKNIRLFKPHANFMLARILKQDVNAKMLAEHCRLKGIIIRDCSDFYGLDEHFIRFCFMKPSQNDLLVNTILELL